MDNTENLLISQIENILDNITSTLEQIIPLKDMIEEKDGKHFMGYLNEVDKIIEEYNIKVNPQIQDKINHIKHLLNLLSDIDNDEDITSFTE